MSIGGAPGKLDFVDAENKHYAVICSSWHDRVMFGLKQGVFRELDDCNASYEVISVPGCFEIPVVLDRVLSLDSFDGAVVLGVVIRGGTAHFEYVCGAVTDGVREVSLKHGKAAGFGVLTVDDESQALDRAGFGDSSEDKGAEAALAAVLTNQILGSLV